MLLVFGFMCSDIIIIIIFQHRTAGTGPAHQSWTKIAYSNGPRKNIALIASIMENYKSARVVSCQLPGTTRITSRRQFRNNHLLVRTWMVSQCLTCS